MNIPVQVFQIFYKRQLTTAMVLIPWKKFNNKMLRKKIRFSLQILIKRRKCFNDVKICIVVCIERFFLFLFWRTVKWTCSKWNFLLTFRRNVPKLNSLFLYLVQHVIAIHCICVRIFEPFECWTSMSQYTKPLIGSLTQRRRCFRHHSVRNCCWNSVRVCVCVCFAWAHKC